MSTPVMVLSVDGGDVEQVLGVFTTLELLERAITAEREKNQYGESDGYLRAASEIDEEGTEYIYIHEDGYESFEFTLCFIIRHTFLD